MASHQRQSTTNTLVELYSWFQVWQFTYFAFLHRLQVTLMKFLLYRGQLFGLYYVPGAGSRLGEERVGAWFNRLRMREIFPQ